MNDLLLDLLRLLSLPEYGLSSLFVVCFLAATIIPITPTPFLAGLIKLSPDLFWPAVIVASIGNTLGGGVDWWMGYGGKSLYEKVTHRKEYGKAMSWLQKFGPKACLLGWLPVVGDPLCIAAGWLKFPFWSCMGYMFIGRFTRFLIVAVAITLLWPGAYTFQ